MLCCAVLYHNPAVGLQVFGLFTVVATATGCLYFLDMDDVAKSDGLTAAGVLLLILNLVFVTVMALLIAKRGGPTVVKWVMWSKHKAFAIPGHIFGTSHKNGSSSMSSTGDAGRTSSVQLGLLARVLTRPGNQSLSVSSGSHQGVLDP